MTSDTTNIFEEIKDLREEYQRLSLKAMREGLTAISQAKESGKYIGTYFEFPTLSFNKNGFPNLSSPFGSGPVDYRGCFTSYTNTKPLINESELQSFNELVEFVRSHEALRRRFTISANPEELSKANLEIDKILIISGIKDSIERHIHTYHSFSYSEDLAAAALAPTIAYVFDSHLRIDISIPILFLKFDFDRFQLAADISVERIPDLQHKARFKINSYNVSAHKQVINSATHALVLKGWSVPNSAHMWNFDTLSKARAYPIEEIDQFFAALRINSPVHTGYAQVYAIAGGWAASCTADLPHLEGVTMRAYPSWFEDYYWNADDFPLISDSVFSGVKATFNQIQSTKENAIKLALKRLNRCLVRDDEEDAVLDATIALEALLSDGNQEMTHKLALRVGALLKLEENPMSQPAQAFSDVKKIYSYRSEIVHGSKNPERKRIIKITEERSVPAHSLLIDYLKMTLRVLLKNEKYREPKRIDEDLLLG
jgi:hypothetical protein